MPSGVYPEIGARIMDLQDPTRKMSTTGGTAEGTVHVLDDALTGGVTSHEAAQLLAQRRVFEAMALRGQHSRTRIFV